MLIVRFAQTDRHVEAGREPTRGHGDDQLNQNRHHEVADEQAFEYVPLPASLSQVASQCKGKQIAGINSLGRGIHQLGFASVGESN